MLQVHPRAIGYRPFLLRAAETLAPMVARFKEAWIEDRPLALTIHYRNVNRDEVPFWQRYLRKALVEFDASLATVDGSMAFEVYQQLAGQRERPLRRLCKCTLHPHSHSKRARIIAA